MGNVPGGPGAPGGPGGPPGSGEEKKEEPKKKKFEPRPPLKGGRRRKKKGASTAVRTPKVFPTSKCKLRLLKLERIKDYMLMEEEFIRNQQVFKPQEEKDKEERDKMEDLRGSPMSVGSLEEMIDDNHAIVSSSVGPEYYVNVLSFVNQDLLEPGCSVLLHNKTNSVVGILGDDADPMVDTMKVDKAPTESYADIGGLESQIQEIKEAVELPLAHPELYEEIGIKPPKGVILYGEPGTGKTLLAKAVANQTSATFLRMVGSELIQKYLGDGPKLVRELFRVADDHSPSIVFIDEIDKICSSRDFRGMGSADASAEGVQRDLLPLIEGSTINTKYGNVDTDHILFIASGAFHTAKPSDLLAELQGRLPIRVELNGLTETDMYKILTEPVANLIRQQTELMKTEEVELQFEPDALLEIARIATEANRIVENIGARRLHSVIERIMEEISFEASTHEPGTKLLITKDLVQSRAGDFVTSKQDLAKFIL
mmetsp:Transcript_14597/g.25681  ORF Transcript_14597/g.25681 Transcript_14597/m.25681 type:complete len:485 (+) Transcript_14597:71-1525(+)